MHSYCSNFAFMYNFTLTDVSVFFLLKCVKWITFYILQDFATTNVVALKIVNFLAFNNLKSYFIYFNNTFYITPYIKTSIFHIN